MIDRYDTAGQKELLEEYDKTVHDYYIKRTDGKTDTTWTERCGKAVKAKPREGVGEHFRKIGFLKR